MAYFDRFDICAAYRALEHDWHNGGWLQERPSNRRRREACSIQLDRMGYRPPHIDYAAGFAYLDTPNEREVYVCALARFGLLRHLDPADSLTRYVRRYFPELLANTHA